MKRKSIYGFFCVMAAATLLISIASTGGLHLNSLETKEPGTVAGNYRTGTDYEVVFTAPFDYVDNGSGWDVHASEKQKWNNFSYADGTGLILLNVSAMNVSEWGKAGAYAAIGGTTIASQSYEKPQAEFYFSGKFTMFDDISLASKTHIRLLYFYYENDEVLDAGVLKEWRQESDVTEYTVDHTENPLSVELDAHMLGNTYTILLFFEAYIEATGGSGTCYIDASNTSLERCIHLEKIRLYDACEWGSNLDVLEYSLTWEEVGPDSVQVGFIRLHNAGTLGSKLDWEIIAWPDWGTWTFEPRNGYDLTPTDGPIIVNVSVRAPNQEYQSFSGNIQIRNTNDENDSVTLPVRLTTPVTHTMRAYLHSVRVLFERMKGSTALSLPVRGQLPPEETMAQRLIFPFSSQPEENIPVSCPNTERACFNDVSISGYFR